MPESAPSNAVQVNYTPLTAPTGINGGTAASAATIGTVDTPGTYISSGPLVPDVYTGGGISGSGYVNTGYTPVIPPVKFTPIDTSPGSGVGGVGANIGPAAGMVLPPGQAMGTTLWAANMAASSVTAAGFKSTPWNNEGAGGWPPPIVTLGGKRCIQFHLPGGGKRIEVEPNHQTFPGSGAWYFGFGLLLGTDYPIGANTWQLVWQLHGNDTTSPKMDLQCRNGQLRINDGHVIGAMGTNRWYGIVVRADFGAGNMTVWANNTLLADRWPTGKSNPNYYLKVGYYRDPIGAAGTVFETGHRLATGYGTAYPAI